MKVICPATAIKKKLGHAISCDYPKEFISVVIISQDEEDPDCNIVVERRDKMIHAP